MHEWTFVSFPIGYQINWTNYTSKLQPLNLGVLKSLKRYYRKLLVKTAIASLDNEYSMDVLRAINLIMIVWQNVLQKKKKKS